MNPKVLEDGRYEVLRTAKDGERRLSETTRHFVLRRDRCCCVFCGSEGRLEIDHIIPWSAGGSDDMDNLRTLCHDCNQARSNYLVPADEFRRLPNGDECVYCNRQLVGEPYVVSIYCIHCNKKAPGVPSDPEWHPDLDKKPAHVEPTPIDPVALERARIALLVARQRASAPPAPMPDETHQEAM